MPNWLMVCPDIQLQIDGFGKGGSLFGSSDGFETFDDYGY